MLHSPTALRSAFDHLGEAYIEFASELTEADLERAGLGEWNVRELLAHAIRAFSTTTAYLDASPSVDFVINTAGEYYRTALSSSPTLHADVAERGRVAGEALRHDPFGVVRSTVESACARVGLADDDAIVCTFAGQIPLLPYLATRIVESGVHLLDLHDALDRDIDLDPTVAEIVVITLVEAGNAYQVIRGLTGRRGLPVDFNILG